MAKFESTFFGYFDNLARLMRAQPLNLGGHASYSGGVGGPPGGFTGWLPQTRVAYDLSEIAASGVPASGASLLDNLNHIRYRLDTLEDAVLTPGVTVLDEDVEIGTGITNLNFTGDVSVTLTAADEVEINIAFSGIAGTLPVASGIYNEDLSAQVASSGVSHFTVAYEVADDSLQLFDDGARIDPATYVLDSNRMGFTVDPAITTGSVVVVDYDTVVSEPLEVGSVVLTDYYTKDETDVFLAGKSDVGHTHVEDDITDLVHDAVSIRGYGVTTSGPTSGQALVYNGSQYVPTTISTSSKRIYGQYIFTIDGLMSDAGEGVKPLRIYAQEVNSTATITEVFCSLDTAATTDDVRINVLLNNSTIFNAPAYVSIPVADNTESRTTNFAITTFTKDDYFKIQLVQDDVAASDLTVHIRYYWETT